MENSNLKFSLFKVQSNGDTCDKGKITGEDKGPLLWSFQSDWHFRSAMIQVLLLPDGNYLGKHGNCFVVFVMI